jgi:pantothenate kinase
VSADDVVSDPDELVARARRLMRPGYRAVLGWTGSPGAGKTTLATSVVERVNAAAAAEAGGREGVEVGTAGGASAGGGAGGIGAGGIGAGGIGAGGVAAGGVAAVYLPMDGFHLANATLERLGRRDRKGALDTFDGWGFLALLQRLRPEADHEIYAPSFRRAVDEPIAGEIAIPAGAGLIVVEGNYLLVDTEPWGRLTELFDESWFCVTPADERNRRLVDRHTRHGRTPDAAAAWAEEVDGVNARLIEETQARADLLVSGTSAPGAGVQALA